MQDQNILDWLSHIHQGSDWVDCRVERKPRQQHPISPPHSQEATRNHKRKRMSESSSHVSKRRIDESTTDQDQNVDSDVTPTKKRLQSRMGTQRNPLTSSRPSLPSRSGSQAQSQSQSQASGRLSPSKQLADMELYHDGMESRKFSFTHPMLPKSLAYLLSELQNCGNGLGVVSRASKDKLEERKNYDLNFLGFADGMFADPAVRDALGPSPAVDDISWILQEATECQETGQAENGWNVSVHFPLLHKSIYGKSRKNQLVGVANCTTAKIIKEYLPRNSLPKMIDFGIYVVPGAEATPPGSASAAAAIDMLRLVMPCGVINHTDFSPFRARPLAVSIETKRSGATPEEAELQIGTWHAAQWKLLSDLVDETGGTFDGLPFLPGILVEGHQWSFVATTREESKTIFWGEQDFGSTRNAVDIYKVIWGLQRIARWVEDTYWPWFKRNALGLPDAC